MKTLADLQELAQSQSGRIVRVVEFGAGWGVIFELSECGDFDNGVERGIVGYWDTEQDAINGAYYDFEVYKMANLLKNDKLFPFIKGVMIKDNPITLTLSGFAEVVDQGRGNDARSMVKIGFTDRSKFAVLNANQVTKIIDMYGGESDEWAGQPVTLWSEHGKWFGKWHWALRVYNYNDPDSEPGTITQKVNKKKVAMPPRVMD